MFQLNEVICLISDLFQYSKEAAMLLATLNIVVLSIFIPLNINIISKISEQYSTAFIIREFENDNIGQWLYWFSLMSLIIAFISIVLDDKSAVLMYIKTPLVIASFLLSLFFFAKAFKRAKQYARGPGFFIQEQFEKIKSSL